MRSPAEAEPVGQLVSGGAAALLPRWAAPKFAHFISASPSASEAVLSEAVSAARAARASPSEASRSSSQKSAEALVAGGIAGATAKTVIAPMDRVKILYQTSTVRAFSFRSAYRTGATIFQNTGVLGLYKGHMATLLRVVPYSGISYMIFDRCEDIAGREAFGLERYQARFIAGAAAGATATACTYPLDVLRARLAVLWRLERSPGYVQAARDILSREGYSGLFAGLKPTLVGIVPYAGTSFVIFHSLKDRAVAWTAAESDADLPTSIRLACGAVAGLAAQTATYPLDIVRRRMQVMGMEGAPCPVYRSMLDAAATIIKTEGPSVLFKGLSMNFVKGPIAVATSFTVNDRLKQAFQRA